MLHSRRRRILVAIILAFLLLFILIALGWVHGTVAAGGL